MVSKNKIKISDIRKIIKEELTKTYVKEYDTSKPADPEYELDDILLISIEMPFSNDSDFEIEVEIIYAKSFGKSKWSYETKIDLYDYSTRDLLIALKNANLINNGKFVKQSNLHTRKFIFNEPISIDKFRKSSDKKTNEFIDSILKKVNDLYDIEFPSKEDYY
jgi:hypothetical protein